MVASMGERFALTLGNGYATDIFLFDRDGSPPQNITSDGSFNRFPQFSPDGTRLAFVSDRAICPSWFPNQPNTCDRTDTSLTVGICTWLTLMRQRLRRSIQRIG
jgi:Tol biopolymer transport system component